MSDEDWDSDSKSRLPWKVWAERVVLLFVLICNVAVGAFFVQPLRLQGIFEMLAFLAVLVVSGLVSAVTVITGRVLLERFRRVLGAKDCDEE